VSDADDTKKICAYANLIAAQHMNHILRMQGDTEYRDKCFKEAFDKLLKENTGMGDSNKIVIRPSKTADSRTCDFTKVTKDELLESSKQHISDVKRGFEFLIEMMRNQALFHDISKITHIDDFHRNFVTGFYERDWWDYHQEVERHHFNEDKYIPSDVNLIDILDQIVDGVMAGMARSGKYRQEPISPELLTRAYFNTVNLLLNNVEVAVDEN
jgi:hypothetical protein